jgi:hypothetical protein
VTSRTARRAPVLCHFAADPGRRPHCTLTAEIAVGAVALCPWATTDGRLATFADFHESQTVTARRNSQFEQGPDADRAPAGILPRNDFPASTRATADAFISQHMPSARPRDAQWAKLEARMDPRRQAVIAKMQRHPDWRWPELQRERAEAQAQARAAAPVHLSSPMTAADGEDVYSAICGSQGPGIGGFR